MLKNKLRVIVVVSALSLFGPLLLSSEDASAAAKTWAGDNVTHTEWSDPDSWSPVGAPIDGDSIVFDCATTNECVSIFDIPGLSVSSVTFQGAVPGDVINLTDAPINVSGNITSQNTGSVFHGVVVMGSDITVHNTVLGSLDLNGHAITFTGEGVDNSSNDELWVGIAGYIIGEGTINVNVNANQEFYLAGANYYSGITNINSTKFVSNGQNPSNKTINMFGVSDVNVEPTGKIVFTFNETDNNLSFLNKISFQRLDSALAQLLLVNSTTNGSLVTVLFPNIMLESDTRFDVDVADGGLSINLAGTVDNGFCIEFGSGNLQSSYFVNVPDCSDEQPQNPNEPESANVSTPKTGVVAGIVVGTSVMAAGGGVGLYARKKHRQSLNISEK